jgi:hypothetical protein
MSRISAENMALIESVCGPLIRDMSLRDDGMAHLSERTLDYLLNRARADGRLEGARLVWAAAYQSPGEMIMIARWATAAWYPNAPLEVRELDGATVVRAIDDAATERRP